MLANSPQKLLFVLTKTEIFERIFSIYLQTGIFKVFLIYQKQHSFKIDFLYFSGKNLVYICYLERISQFLFVKHFAKFIHLPFHTTCATYRTPCHVISHTSYFLKPVWLSGCHIAPLITRYFLSNPYWEQQRILWREENKYPKRLLMATYLAYLQPKGISW